MGTLTTNLELYKPAVGEKDYAEEVNENFDTIDTALHALDIGKVAVGSGTPSTLAAYDSAGKVVNSSLPLSSITARKFHVVLQQYASGALSTGEIFDRFLLTEAGYVRAVGAVCSSSSAGDDCSIDVQYSTDGGASFSSLLDAYITIPDEEVSSAVAPVQPEVKNLLLPVNTLLRGYVLDAGTNFEDTSVVLSVEV